MMLRNRHRPEGRVDRTAIRRVGISVVSVGVLVALLAVSRSLAPPPATPRPADPWTGRCVGVADGDTISVMYHGATVRVRLNAVDCPEKSQAFGSVAKRFTSDRVFGKAVTVNPTDTDRYGRTVADVLTSDGRSLNEALVAAGLAWWYRQYAPRNTRLETLEHEAQRAKRGLWADADPTPPWEFRREKRSGARTNQRATKRGMN